MAEIKEHKYRDYLAQNLDLVEKGLVFEARELHLPNDHGAKGFVDLVARDRYGALVLIELKRSDSAARSAIHELFKYVALVHENFGLAPHELRCILLSTTWHELLVPFSELVAVAPFKVEGHTLEICQNDLPTATSPIEPIRLGAAVEVCPKHWVSLYTDTERRAEDSPRLQKALAGESVDDFFTLVLDHDQSGDGVIYPFALYTVMAELSQTHRSRIDSEEAAEHGDESEELDADNWDHEETVQSRVIAATDHDDMEIGYPDKLRQILESWKIVDIIRSGRFASSVAWPNHRLVSRALGEEEGYATHFTSLVDITNEHAFNRMLKGIDRNLLGATWWHSKVPLLLRYLKREMGEGSLSVRIFNPADALLGLAALSVENFQYLPTLEVVAHKDTGETRFFVGQLHALGKLKSPTSELLKKYTSNPIDYHSKRHFGELWMEEKKICQAHGLRYVLYEVKFTDDSVAWNEVKPLPSQLVAKPISEKELDSRSLITFSEKYTPYLDALATELFRNFAFPNPF